MSYYNGTLEEFQAEYGLSVPNSVEFRYEVVSSGLRIRSEPSVNSTIIGQRALGDIVIPTDFGGSDIWLKDGAGWSAIKTGGSIHMKRVGS